MGIGLGRLGLVGSTVGDYDIDTMRGETGYQFFVFAFIHRQEVIVEGFYRLPQEAVGQQLRHHVTDTDAQTPESTEAASVKNLDQFLASVEHRIGVVEHQLSGLAQGQTTATAVEQRRTDIVLEFGKLTGQGLGREMQTFRRARQTLFVSDNPEVIKMLVVGMLHRRSENHRQQDNGKASGGGAIDIGIELGAFARGGGHIVFDLDAVFGATPSDHDSLLLLT